MTAPVLSAQMARARAAELAASPDVQRGRAALKRPPGRFRSDGHDVPWPRWWSGRLGLNP
jgi:hypothetical protein